jgi:luciferase family oxidoreductase group 1
MAERTPLVGKVPLKHKGFRMSTTSSHASPVNLGILDCWSSVAQTVALAEAADELGYSRFWLTEHPPQPNPQTIAALLAGVTERIRVGTAGILLNYHSPLRAAQEFLLLEHVFPGRIDAGFCAGAAPGLAHQALRDGRPEPTEADSFDRRAEELIGFLRGRLASDHPFHEFQAWPMQTGAPEIWSFGTGRRSAELAARHGTAFGYSLFHNFSRDDTSNVAAYRDAFRVEGSLSEPLVAIAVAGVCAETDDEAEQMRREHRNDFLVPTIVGSPETCRERIEAIAQRYGTPEIVFLDLSPNAAAQQRSIRLLAEELDLGAHTEAHGSVLESTIIYSPAV